MHTPSRSPACAAIRAWVALLAAITALALLVASLPLAARTTDGPGEVSVERLPPEARHTLDLIAAGGPFPYDRDGIVFGNREHILPSQHRGYYHEYTVPTPGEHSRGARRVICGGARRSVAECYYTDDHYRSFRRIVP
jgi:ribonuclease T1